MAVEFTRCFLTFDLAGAEWVIVAYLTEDENMLSVVMCGKSPHVATAALMFGVTEEYVKQEEKDLEGCNDPGILSEYRRSALDASVADGPPAQKTARAGGKECNFSLNYGVGPDTFSIRAGCTFGEAKRLIKLYTQVAYPGLPRWHARTQELVGNHGYLVNCFGRRRDFYGRPGPQLWTDTYAFIPQSTVFDITRIAMVNVYNEEPLAELLAQDHDAITVQMPLNDPGAIAGCVARIREWLAVPLVYGGREFRLGSDAKIGFCRNKRLMVGIPPDAETRQIRACIEQAREKVR